MRAGLASRVVISVLAGLALGFVGPGSPAWAHVEVTADKPQAGATDVTVTINGEAESNTAGIASARVTLPEGITPAQVRLGTAPTGWAFSTEPTAFTVAGPALPVGTNAVFSVVIDQLPYDKTELVFKTIITYNDGTPVRWIDETVPGQPEPEHPAPVLKLAPATSGPPPTTTPAPTSTTGPQTSTSPASPAAPPDDRDNGGLWWLVGAGAVIVAAVAAALIARRRGTPPSSEGGSPS